MNGKERIQKVLNGEMPDRTPVMLHNFLMAIRENGYTVEQYRKDPKIIAEVFEKTVYKYDVDGILLDMDTAFLSSLVGVETDYPADEPARNHDGLISSLDEVEHLKKVDFSVSRAAVYLEAAQRLVEKIGKDIYIRGNCDQAAFSLAGLIRGTEDFLVDILTEEEEKVRALLEYASRVTCSFMSLMAETGVDMLSNGDSSAGPDMVSPSIYKTFAYPYEKQIVHHCHKLGLPYLLHICGDTTDILDEMVDTGADCLELDYKTDIQAIRKATKDKTVFVGNLDPSGVICMGSKETVIEKTKELMESQKNNPRFIFNAGCAIPAITPEENVIAMLDVVRNYGG